MIKDYYDCDSCGNPTEKDLLHHIPFGPNNTVGEGWFCEECTQGNNRRTDK